MVAGESPSKPKVKQICIHASLVVRTKVRKFCSSGVCRETAFGCQLVQRVVASLDSARNAAIKRTRLDLSKLKVYNYIYVH